MLLKQHGRVLKIAITGVALVVAIVVVGMEVNAQREFNALAAQRDADLERNKPFYECLIAAAAITGENPSMEEVLAAGKAERECYERFNR
jgi:hypothetical protein